jgi:hypothetical protein
MDEAIAVMIGGCRAALSGLILFGAPQTNYEDLAKTLDKNLEIILDPLRRGHFDEMGQRILGKRDADKRVPSL